MRQHSPPLWLGAGIALVLGAGILAAALTLGKRMPLIGGDVLQAILVSIVPFLVWVLLAVNLDRRHRSSLNEGEGAAIESEPAQPLGVVPERMDPVRGSTTSIVRSELPRSRTEQSRGLWKSGAESMSGDNQRQSDTTASGAFSQADYAVHGAAYEILRRTLSLSVEARNARMDAWRELEEAHREAQAARDDAYRQVAELQEKINRALEQERSLLEQALEEARRLAEEAQSLRNAAQQEVAHAQEQRREAEIMRQEALRLLTQASFGDPGGSAGGEPPIEEPAEKPLEKPAESPLAGDRNEPEEEPNSLQSSLSPENGAGPQSSPEDLSSAYNVSYKGQFAIVVKPLPPADTLGRVWAALEQVVGIGRIIGSLPLEDGSGLEFTLDMGKDRVSVAELVSTIPEATAEPVSQDTLVINLAEGQ